MIATLLLAATLSPATEWAHEEFTNFTTRIFGAAPAVEFVLPGETADFADDFRALKDTDGYAVRTRNGRIVFVADNPKGHVNGVHRWLERNSDIIWPRPAKDLCFFTKRRDAASPEFAADYIDIPVFTARHACSNSYDPETWRFFARNAATSMVDVRHIRRKHRDLEPVARKYGFMGAFDDMFGCGHDMEAFWFPRAEFFKDHPEYWMEVDGRRWEGPWSNFCETNPGFVRAFSESVERKIADLPPGIGVISINMEDQALTCTCGECMKPIRLEDGTTVGPDDPAFRSTRFFVFFNQVARHIARIRPDLRILQFAYLHLAEPPKVRIERNVILKFCPFPRNMRESVVEGPSNRLWRERTDAWLDNTPNIYWREYYFCSNQHFPRPICDGAAVDLRYVAKRGVKMVYTDSASWGGDTEKLMTGYSLNRPFSDFFTMSAVEQWTLDKLFWDPNLDPEELRHEFLRRTFGPAARPLIGFYGLIRDGWYADSRSVTYGDDPYMMTLRYVIEKGNAEKCVALLAEAEKAADNPERRAWTARMSKVFGEWLSEAKGRGNGAFEVPFNPDGKGKWAKFPTLMPVRARRGKDSSGSAFEICSDGKAFRVRVTAKKEGAPLAVVEPGPDGFPCGDKAELFFGGADGSNFQFAFDSAGRKFEAKGPDAKWTCNWKVEAAPTADGWTALAEIPFSALGFAPNVNPRIKFLPMLSVRTKYAAGERNFTWKAAMPHRVGEWGELNVAFAP